MNTDQGVKMLLWANLANTSISTGNGDAAMIFSIITALVAWPIFKEGWKKSKATP